MSAASFTPGPWAVRHEKWVIATRGEHEGEILIAPTYWMEHVPEEAAANARLIAAAPSLLTALRDLMDAVALGDDAGITAALNAAEAAEAKATGSRS
jgi:hypothetical protein